jgi:hypothetical protein
MTPESIQLECEARQRQIDQQWAELPYLYAEACREGRATPTPARPRGIGSNCGRDTARSIAESPFRRGFSVQKLALREISSSPFRVRRDHLSFAECCKVS